MMKEECRRRRGKKNRKKEVMRDMGRAGEGGKERR